jgi:hypothetical protein
MSGEPQGAPAPVANRPFGHAMTKRAQQVTVQVHDLTPAPATSRTIPVLGHEATAGETDLPIDRSGGGGAVA